MKNYAYLDKYGDLHLDDDFKSSKQYAKLNGKVAETNLKCEFGYAVVEIKDELCAIHVDSDLKVTVNGKVENADKYPEVIALYKSLM